MPYPTVDFKATNIGQNSFAVRPKDQGMDANAEVSINGTTNLHDVIKFNDNGCVFSITLTGSPGYYDYVLNVDAQGPKGFTSGSGHLAFTDANGEVYRLFIYSSTRSVHTLRYSSDNPKIEKIEWNNRSIK